MGQKIKSALQVRQHHDAERERVIQDMLRFSRTRFKRFDEIIQSLYDGEDLSRYYADRRIWKMNDCFHGGKIKSTDREPLRKVFTYLSQRTVVLANEYSIHAVLRMFQYRHYWHRNIFSWKPTAARTNEQVEELTLFLFCKYAVPAFMFRAVYEEKEMIHMQWLAHLGAGGSPKEMVDLPFAFTRKTTQYFLCAPAKLTIAEALRWAQAKGVNAVDELADRIASSWLAHRSPGDEAFWETFIRLLTHSQPFYYGGLTELVDYVREMRRLDETYSLKGRTLRSLTRQSEEWHQHYINPGVRRVWETSGIQEFNVRIKEERLMISEITDSQMLSREGQQMRHCVASYALMCANGKTAIFSMRKYLGTELLETLATIEVNISLKRIMQAKGKLNKKVSEEALKHMNEWARREGLMINNYL